MELILEILKYSTQGFWIFIGCWGLFALGITLILKTLSLFFDFISVLIRGHKPPKIEKKCDCKSDGTCSKNK